MARRFPTAWRMALGALPLLSFAAGAQEPDPPANPPSDAPAQAVEVHGMKNPAVMPYRTAYDVITGVDKVAGRRLQLLIRLTSAPSGAPLPDLEVRLVGEHTRMRVPVSAAGLVELPLDRGAYDDAADIVANKAKNTMRVGIVVVPRFAAGEIRYADVVDSVSAGRAAIAEIIPWYLRLLTPGVHGVAFCYPSSGQVVAIHGREDTVRAATVEDTDPMDGRTFCARFTPKEAFDPGTVLIPADGWQAMFW